MRKMFLAAVGAAVIFSPAIPAMAGIGLNKYINAAKENGLITGVAIMDETKDRIEPAGVPAYLEGPFAVDYIEDVDNDGLSKQAVRIVREEFGLPKITVKISARNVAFQSNAISNKIGFEQALREAMKSFLEDPDDPESPLALMIDDAYDELLPGVYYSNSHPPEVIKRAKEQLYFWLNRPTTIVSMLRLDQVPDHGESIFKNWIMYLWIPDYSDHGHWAVTDRSGTGKPTYNYGFN